MSKFPQESGNVKVGGIDLPYHIVYPQSGSMLAAQFQRPAHEVDCQPHFPPSFTEAARDPVNLTNRSVFIFLNFFFWHLNQFQTATQALQIKQQVQARLASAATHLVR
jgi:hypothetical protein